MRDADTGRKVALLLVASLTVMASAIIAASLPRMAQVFSATPHAEFLSKLVLTTPALMIMVFGPLAGAIIDRFGRLRFLYANLVLYGAAGASGYVLEDLNHILVGRALLGVAIAGTMTTMNTLTGDYWAGEARTRFASLQSFSMSMGGVVFVGVGGLLADLDWRLPFLVYLSAWPVLIPAMRYLEEPGRQAPGADYDAGPEQAPVASLATVYGLTFFAMVMFYMTVVQLPFVVRDLGIPSSALAGLAIVTSSLVSAVASMAYPRLRGGAGFVTMYAAAMLLVAAGYAIIAFAPGYAAVLLGAAISGFGVGIIFPNGHLWIFVLAPARLRGRLVGMMSASMYLGQFCSPVLVQPAVVTVGLAGAFGVFAAFGSVVALLLLAVGRGLGKALQPEGVPRTRSVSQ